jgi:hypothetical protein
MKFFSDAKLVIIDSEWGCMAEFAKFDFFDLPLADILLQGEG